MNGNIEGERSMFPDLSDSLFMATRRLIGFIPPVGKIPESEIADFCGGCDFLQPQNTCEKFDSNTQAILAERKFCAIPMVNSSRGTMTEDGFIPK